jgi:hypothetical protein
MSTRVVEFTYRQEVSQTVHAFAHVPAELTSEDDIIDWLREHPEHWNEEKVLDEDIIDAGFASIKVEETTP